MSLTARELLRYGDVEASRRRRQRYGGLPVTIGAVQLVLAALLAGEIARRYYTGDTLSAFVSASHLCTAAALIAGVGVLFGAPFRMFWRHDSAFLGRLSIPGDALYKVALVRGFRATAVAMLPAIGAAVAIGALFSWDAAARQAGLIAAAAAGGAFLGPAATLWAGAIVSSDKAQSLIDSFGGEFRAPKTAWIGVIPGVAGAIMVLGLLALAPWPRGGEPVGGAPLLTIGVWCGACAVLLLLALQQSGRVMLAAQREVAALDQERLAHIDRSQPSPLERAWFGLLSAGARTVAVKDAQLSRRRYPSPYFLGPVAVITVWILAASQPAGYLSWATAILIGAALYSALMSRRLVTEPVEHRRFLATLAVGTADAGRAKRHASTLRVITWIVVAAAPLAVVAGTALAIGVAIVVTVVALAFSYAALSQRG